MFPLTVAGTIRIAHGLPAMICRVACTPSTCGMIRSIRIKSGRSRLAIAIASTPSAAVQATVWSGRLPTTRRSASLAARTSLTIAILKCFGSRPPRRHGHRIEKGLVMEAGLCQVAVRAGFEPAEPILLPVLVRHDHDGNVPAGWVGLDQRHQTDAVQAGHVDVAHHQVVLPAADGVPAVHSVDRHVDVEAP